MFYHFLKTSIRGLFKTPLFSLINIFGLSLGLGTCLIIFSYWSFEKSYDQFHPNHEKIFRVAQVKSIEGGGEILNASVFSKVGQAFLNQETIAESLVRIHRNGSNTSIQVENDAFLQPGIIGAEESFFDLFQFDFISGSAADWQSTPQSVVLTKSTATKLFGDEDPLGKPIQINGSYGIYGTNGYKEFKNYTVAGVIKDLPGNTHLDFSAIISLDLFADPEQEFSNWGDQFYTYIKLNTVNTQAELEETLDRIAKDRFSESGIDLYSQPLSSIHLDSNLNNEFKPNGSQSVIWILGLIAFIVLIIACANYINFSLARSLQRKKELHLRKIFWAKKYQLFQQLTIEAFLINLEAFTLAIILLILLQPILEYLIGFDLIDSLLEPKNIMTWLAIFLIGVVLSGIYPAWAISGRSFNSFYKAGFQPPSFQKPLIIFQFALTIFVIAFSLLIYSQINFMKTQNLGFNPENVLVLSGPSVEAENINLDQRFESFKDFLSSQDGIGKVSSANFIPGQAVRGKAEGYIRQLGQLEESAHTYFFTQLDTEFLKNFEFNISAGRTFSEIFTDENGVIINEEASRLLGFPNPSDAIGKKIYYRRNTTPEIIGVVENFHLFGLQKQYEPVIFELGESPNQFLYLTVQSEDTHKMLADLSDSWAEYFPGNPFNYFYLNEFFQKQYQRDENFYSALKLFSGLTILISILGFYGLIHFISITKTKELTVRKILGASFSEIFTYLGKGPVLYLIAAGVLSLPLTYLLAENWLRNYAFRVSITWWNLLLPVLFFGFLIWTLIVTKTHIVFREKPANSLRNE